MKNILIIYLLTFLSFNAISQEENGIVYDSIYSEALEESRDYWVKLPDNYNPKSEAEYPVVFLLDGFSMQNMLVTVYETYWGHYMPHMILVGISNRNNRTQDLTESSNREEASDDFIHFIGELITHIDSEYNCSDYRTLIGHSYAGLLTINILLNHDHMFRNYISIDPSLHWDQQHLLAIAKNKMPKQDLKGKALFISLAAEQLNIYDESVTMDNLMQDTSEFSRFARAVVAFSEFIESQSHNGLNFAWKAYPEDLHGTVPLPTMRDGLVYLFNWYQFQSPQKYNNPDTPIEELKELLQAQAKIYSENLGVNSPPLAEELFIGYGFMYMHTGRAKKAELFLTQALEFYPKSLNVLDALIEFANMQDDEEASSKYRKLAYELSGDRKYMVKK